MLPTLLDLLGLPPVGELQGRSYADLLRGGSFEARPIVAQSSWRGVELASVRDGPWKLIVDAKEDRRELYNLAEDTGELHDVAGQEPGHVERLASLLLELSEDPTGTPLEDSTGEVDREAEERLRALGYLGEE